jgi:chitosanase
MNDLQKQTCLAIVNVFETGSPKGNYGAVTLLPGDTGHLTYGRSQTTLATGNLYLLIKAYVDNPDAQYADEFRHYLGRLSQKDLSLDNDLQFRSLLREAGSDLVMQAEQDSFFDRAYYQPAMNSAANVGLTLPLSLTVVYDSNIQGAWGRVSKKLIDAIGKISNTCPEKDWVGKYVGARRDYLKSCKPPVPATTYRMDAFDALIAAEKWDLALPLTVREVHITADIFAAAGDPAPVRASVPDSASATHPILRPTTPYIKGADVLDLQTALNTAGFKNAQDGIYGPFAQALVAQFQGKSGLKPDAIVGPQTWAALLEHQAGPA